MFKMGLNEYLFGILGCCGFWADGSGSWLLWVSDNLLGQLAHDSFPLVAAGLNCGGQCGDNVARVPTPHWGALPPLM